MSSEKKNTFTFPEHWGSPPKIQTRDLRPFPSPFDLKSGSSSVVNWIEACMKRDAQRNHPHRVRNVNGPWKEMVGISGEIVQEMIEKDVNSDNAASSSSSSEAVDVLIVPKCCNVVTMDHRLNRVRIYVDENGKVERPPCRG